MPRLLRVLPLIIVFLLIAISYIMWGWSHELSGMGGDSAGYLLAAQYYSPYQPSSAILAEYSRSIIYPPLFPWVLAILGGGESILIAHLVVISFLLMGMLVLYFWLRLESVSSWQSAAIVTLFALMPTTYLQSLDILTENVYLFFSLAALLCVRIASTSTNNKIWWLAAVAVACATLSRAAAVSLLGAFCLFVLLRRPKNYLGLIAFSVLPFLLWTIIGSKTAVGIAGYSPAWTGRLATSPFSTIVDQFIHSLPALVFTWEYSWLGDSQPLASQLIVLIFGLVCIVGWLYRLKRLEFDGIYTAAYLLMLFAWSHPEPVRYSYALYPVLIAQGFMLLNKSFAASRNLKLIPTATPAISIILLLAMLPTFVINAGYFFEYIPPEIREGKHVPGWYDRNRSLALVGAYGHVALISHIKDIAKYVPENDCVYSIKPAVITLYSRRSSLRPPLVDTDEQAFWQGMQKCRYVYVLPFASSSYGEVFYPLHRLGASAKIISVMKVDSNSNLQPIGILLEIVK